MARVLLSSPPQMVTAWRTCFWDSYGSLPPGHLLTAGQIADSVVRAMRQPDGVDVNTVVVRPVGQPV